MPLEIRIIATSVLYIRDVRVTKTVGSKEVERGSSDVEGIKLCGAGWKSVSFIIEWIFTDVKFCLNIFFVHTFTRLRRENLFRNRKMVDGKIIVRVSCKE